MPIYTKEMLDLMTVIRRRVKAEFNIVIRFSSEDTLDVIQDLAKRSADSTTKQKALQLLQMSGKVIELEDLARPARNPSATPHSSTAPAHSHRRVRIYRGQVVA